MIISRYHLDRCTFLASIVLALLWATDELWEQAFIAVAALVILSLRIYRERNAQ